MARRICCCGRKRKRTFDSEWHLITMVAIAYSFGYILVSKTSLIDVLSLNIVLIICLFDALNYIFTLSCCNWKTIKILSKTKMRIRCAFDRNLIESR